MVSFSLLQKTNGYWHKDEKEQRQHKQRPNHRRHGNNEVGMRDDPEKDKQEESEGSEMVKAHHGQLIKPLMVLVTDEPDYRKNRQNHDSDAEDPRNSFLENFATHENFSNVLNHSTTLMPELWLSLHRSP
jgi:hypothetical protein